MARRRRATFTMGLPRWQRWSIYGVGFVVTVSGVAWLVLQLSGATDQAFSAWRGLQHFLTAMHGASSLVALVLLGSVIPVHIRLSWHFKRHIVSGISLSIALLVLALTSVVLYYGGDNTLRTASAWVHEAVGAIAIGLFFAHWWMRNRP